MIMLYPDDLKSMVEELINACLTNEGNFVVYIIYYEQKPKSGQTINAQDVLQKS